MKSLIAILFATLFFLQAFVPNMDLCCEVPKIPVLFEHYKEHVAHDGISFFDFLNLHYGTDQESAAHHHGDEHDEKLPLHGEHQCNHAPMYYCSLEVPFQMSYQTFPMDITFGFYSFSLTSEYSESPFQPPKA
ncbi:hypothetical protein N7E81_13870 [Reichenbachiella carrageenanivorans]|uniref:Uncharacterized protein n=1 Tax=Reichenbachiella carrageenanivorans TaxID=2979869 RepID=A0ABY6CXJ4_9BACT|nr:hypothetical protein [Reichenbachiella carrageenanivorans]UXX78444.1 hypothetical protein N7E81_13870 [Reichenbachiella carrageenanivorans]